MPEAPVYTITDHAFNRCTYKRKLLLLECLRHLTIWLSSSLCLCVCLPVCLSVCQSVSQSVSLSVPLSVCLFYGPLCLKQIKEWKMIDVALQNVQGGSKK